MQAPEGNDVSLYPIGIDWRRIDPREYLLRDPNASLYYYEMQAADKLKLITVMRECACHRQNRFDFKYMLMGINIFLMLCLATNNDLVASLILELLDFQHFAILSVFLPLFKRIRISSQTYLLKQICKPSKLNYIRIQECLESPVNSSQLYLEYLNLQPLKENAQIDSIEFTDREIISASFNPVYNIIALHTNGPTFYIYKYDSYYNEKKRKVIYFERVTRGFTDILSWSPNGKYFYFAIYSKSKTFQLHFYYYNQYMETFAPIQNNFMLLDVHNSMLTNNLWLSEKSFFYYLESENTCYEYSFENDNNYPSQTVLSSSLNRYFPKFDKVKHLVIFNRNLFIVHYGCPFNHHSHYSIMQYNVDQPDVNVHYQYTGAGKHLQLTANNHMLASLSGFHPERVDGIMIKQPYNSFCKFDPSNDRYDDDQDDNGQQTIALTMFNVDFLTTTASRIVR